MPTSAYPRHRTANSPARHRHELIAREAARPVALKLGAAMRKHGDSGMSSPGKVIAWALSFLRGMPTNSSSASMSMAGMCQCQFEGIASAAVCSARTCPAVARALIDSRSTWIRRWYSSARATMIPPATSVARTTVIVVDLGCTAFPFRWSSSNPKRPSPPRASSISPAAINREAADGRLPGRSLAARRSGPGRAGNSR